MNDDILLDQAKLFNRYYRDALVIRAICDDMEFPAEYSPIFVNIHIKGVEYFRGVEKQAAHFEKVFKLLSPEVAEQLEKNTEKIKSEEARKILKNICIGKKIEDLDRYLEETTGVADFLSNQLRNQKKLYLEEDYREHMLALYIFFVKPYIGCYTDKMIEKAFYRGRIQDINREIKRAQGENPEVS